jgi:SAM-dependent methyltransferase
MPIKKYTHANRKAWNEAHLVHREQWKVDFKELFRNSEFSTLDEIEKKKVNELNIKGKSIGQLCCNNGRELLSLMKLGASWGCGFDISDAVLRDARELARISGLNCEFVRTDVYDIGKEYFNRFDLIYLSSGALTWLPDLPKFFALIHKMLRKNGHLVIYELHPVVNMLAVEYEKDYSDPLKITYPYFRKDPWVDNDGIDYIGKTIYRSETSYSFSQTLSEILNAVIASGISLKEFNEYPHDISGLFSAPVIEKNIPLSYMLIGKKES